MVQQTMGGAIELPGEAAPLTPQQVYLALQSAGSTQQQFIRTATQQLQTWESQPGYFSLLQAAYLDKSLPTEIRYLAIIQLKNGIDKYWRKSATNAIKSAEKTQIRSRLLEGGIDEADPQLALQNALTISKVVRIDYPAEWPEILTSLVATLRTANESNQLHSRRGLLILLQIVKELATARLRKSQTSLQSVTPELVLFLGHIYTQKVGFWMEFLGGNGDDEGGAMDAMENSLLAMKILRRLLLVGYEYPHHHKEVQEIWAQSQQQFGQFLDMVTCEPAVIVSPAKDIVEKHMLQLAKLHSHMANTHPAAYALLPNSLDLTRAFWGLITKYGDSYASARPEFGVKHTLLKHDDMKEDVAVMEKLSLKGLLILRSCVKMVFSPTQSFKYRTTEVKEEQNKAINLIKTQLLTDELICQIAEVVVTKFFVFRQADLNAWEEDPDEWEIRRDGAGDAWELEVRPCSEKLFLDIVLNFKQLLKEPLLGFFQSVNNASQGTVLTKDSVYTAMGLCAPAIYDDFDFDAFLISTLVNDVQQAGPGYNVLRRRIAILIARWVSVKIAEANRPLVYQIFQHLLNPQDETNDQIVRVSAARNFEWVAEDFGFNVEQFLPFAPAILGHFLALIQEVENVETQMAVLQTIRVTSVRLEHHVAPFADKIVSILPQLWETSGEEHLLKQAILALLCSLVAAMKEQSQRYNPLILPLIQQAVVSDTDINVFLMEESLELWSAILTQTPAPAQPEVIQLAESTFPLLDFGSENLRMVLTIVESYILLAPEAMLGDAMRLRTLSYMTNLLITNKRELAGLVTTIVERMIQAADNLGGKEGIIIVTKDLFESGYTEKIVEGLRDAWEAHQTVGPDRRYPKLDDIVETDYFTILARIALADPETFMKMLSSMGSIDNSWEWLSTEWFRHFDSMANLDRQKLSCLALTRLLELPAPLTNLVLGKLQDYFAMWTSVVGEMQDGRLDGGDNLVWAATEGTEYESPEDVRKRLQAAADPVHTIHTLQFINMKMQKVIENCGGEAAFQQVWGVNVDSDILESFRAVSSGTKQKS